MRIINIFLIALLLVTTGHCSVTIEQVFKVFSRMSQASNSHVRLYIDNNSSINAITDITGIHMYTGMMKFLDDEDQLAIIIGHELGHVAHRDIWHTHTKYMELSADLYGFQLSRAAGYNACSGIEVLRNFGVILGDGVSKTHPRSSIRYKVLGKYCHS